MNRPDEAAMSPGNAASAGRVALLLLLWLTGIAMRAPILVAAPLGPRIAHALGLGQAGTGALTTLPVLALGLGALPAAWLIARFGARTALIAAVVITGMASAARGLATDTPALIAATAGTGLGIAVMQPALPALLARWCPGFVALAATVYLNGMMVGEFLGAGLTLPLILPRVGDWRATLLAVSLPIVALGPLLALPREHAMPGRANPPRTAAWNEPRVWRFGLLLGLTAATFFALNAYMPAVLASRGLGDRLGWVLAAFNATQLATSLVLMVWVRRVLAVPRLLAWTVLLHLGGLLVVITSGSLWLVAGAIAVSLASAMQLIVLTSLPPLLFTAERAGAVAAGMFAIGYVLAFSLPLVAGTLIDASGRVAPGLAFLLALTSAALPLAWTTRSDPAHRAGG